MTTTARTRYTSAEIRELAVLPDTLPAMQQRDEDIRLVLYNLEMDISQINAHLEASSDADEAQEDWARRAMMARKFLRSRARILWGALKQLHARMNMLLQTEQGAQAQAAKAARIAAYRTRDLSQAELFVEQAKASLPRETYVAIWEAVNATHAAEDREEGAP